MADTDPMQQQVLGHLLGALEDDEQEWLEAMLECDEEYRREWMAWRSRLAPLMAARPDVEPPAGLAARTCRLVAAYGPVSRKRQLRPRRMSPDSTVSGGVSRIGWLDAAAVAMVLLVMAVLVPPAIQGSRFQSRLANCQDKLRQVGLDLTQYGYRHGNDISDLADNEKLTDAGQPLHWSRDLGTWDSDADGSANEFVGVGPVSPTERWFECAKVSSLDWPGTWRNGMIAGVTNLHSSAVALLADAPSADLPGQTLDGHDGQGRNMFFEDGHVDFLISSSPPAAAELLLSHGDAPTAPNISVPIRFTTWH